MNKRMIILTLALAVLTATAQEKKKERTVELTGYVVDQFTRVAVPQDSLRVLVLGTDSAVVDTASVYSYETYRGFKKTGYDAKVPTQPAKYIIKATHPDYETTFVDYEVKRVGRNRSFDVPAIAMHRVQRSSYDKDGGSLQEVVVKATKVKMVYRGDTIIYNADAFNVPEGSMLDALIKQLPGVELKEGGEIFVNGRKVDNLTLNGADFFKGKNKMMLDNLPYFTVKNIQVYDKQTPRSKFMGRDVEQKEYTMDVVLKREYRIGGTAQAEAGAGTNSRYRAKGFGLRYSDHSRAVLFGGVNNLNEYSSVGGDGEERNRTTASGDRDVRQVGGLWTLGTSEKGATNTLEYTFDWEDNHTEQRGLTENYLAGASTFGKSNSWGNDRPFRMNVRNNFHLQKPFFLYSWIDFDYAHGHSSGESTSLTARDVLFGDSVNLNQSRSMNSSDRYSLNLNNQLTFKLPWGDQVDMSMQGSIGRTWNACSFSQNSYRFFATDSLDQRNQFNDSPSHGLSASASVEYRLNLTEHLSLIPGAGLGYDYNESDHRLYRLDWLGPEWAVGSSHPIGSLPSGTVALGSSPAEDALLLALDLPNSSDQTFRQNMQSVGLSAYYNRQTEKSFIYLYGQLSEKFRRNHETYVVGHASERANADVVEHAQNKNYHFPQMYLNAYLAFNNWHKTVDFYMQNSSTMPRLNQMVDITSTANPLNITKGNPNLKPSTNWNFSAGYSVRKDTIDQNIRIGLNGTLQRNAFANAYTYDPTTGIYTTWTENVNGNWNLSSSLYFNRALGRKKFWHTGATLTTSVNQSTDLSSLASPAVQYVATQAQQTEQTEQVGQRNRVTSTRISLVPTLRYQREKLTIGLNTAGAWQHIHRSLGAQPSSSAILAASPVAVSGSPDDTYDFSYGINANYQLPWHFTLDTDLTMHSRRGYSEAEMNDDRLYWDATLTKSFREGRWVMKLKAYDILGQVSQWQYTVNSQGRYETWTNNLRRYILLSVAYRFTQKPKEKK